MAEYETIGGNYASYLLELWKDIGELREEFREEYLVNYESPDPTTAREYAVKMTSLWGELLPKVDGSAFSEKDKEKFMRFRPGYYDPNLLVEGYFDNDGKAKGKPDASILFQLDETLRYVLEKLKITVFEDV